MKFRDDSLIDCQDICENAVHLFMLKVLPERRFLGYKWGGGRPLKQSDTLGIYLPQNMFCGALSVNRVLWTALYTLPKN